MSKQKKMLGHYELLSELGRGGMGVVYKAHDASLNRTVALKVLPRHLVQNQEFVKRFLLEARAAAQLNHPNVVTIYYVGREGKFPFIAMEYVEGTSLSDIIKEEGPMDPKRATQFALQMAGALRAAHDLKIIHRDIKPQNVLVDKSERVKVMDFGLAKMTEEFSDLTQPGALLGTPAYMAPEQCRGAKVDHRVDLYALGIVLFQMLAGRVPFRGQTPLLVIHNILTEPPPPIQEFNGGVSQAIVSILQMLLAKSPEDRYLSAKELEEDLKAAIKELDEIGPGGHGPGRQGAGAGWMQEDDEFDPKLKESTIGIEVPLEEPKIDGETGDGTRTAKQEAAAEFIEKGDGAFFTGDHTTAMRWYSRAMQADDHCLEAWIAHIRVLNLTGQLEDAQTWVRRGMEIFPGDTGLMALEAVTNALSGSIGEALRISNSIIAMAGLDLTCWMSRGHVLLISGDRNANSCFEQCIDISLDEDWKTPFLIGMILDCEGKSARAIAFYEAALDRRSALPYAWYRIAMDHAELGQRQSARRALARAEELCVDNDRLLAKIQKAELGSVLNRLKNIFSRK